VARLSGLVPRQHPAERVLHRPREWRPVGQPALVHPRAHRAAQLVEGRDVTGQAARVSLDQGPQQINDPFRRRRDLHLAGTAARHPRRVPRTRRGRSSTGRPPRQLTRARPSRHGSCVSCAKTALPRRRERSVKPLPATRRPAAHARQASKISRGPLGGAAAQCPVEFDFAS
jgi:hypothetical protein